jgi:hypothetical protein
MIETWKRSVILWSVLASMLALGAPVQANGSNGKGDDEPDVTVENDPHDKDLVKVTHVFRRAKPGGGGPGGTSAYKLAPWKWNVGELHYWLYTSNLGAANLVAGETFSSVYNGFSAWSAANPKAPIPTATEDSTTTPPTAAALNGVNQVFWTSLGATSTIAVTTTWYNRKTGFAVEFDMAFNTYYPWSNSGEASKMDVWNIAAHESGHAFGMDHATSSTELTMYPTAGYGETQKRDLAPGDIAGILARYP